MAFDVILCSAYYDVTRLSWRSWMGWFLDRTVVFFIENLPPWQTIATGAPLGLAWSFACLWFAGRLKQKGIRTGYTRKVFHFLIFTTAALIQWRFGTPALCLFGGMCTLVVFFAVWRGAGTILYEAMAREKDEPHRTYFILVPYFATLVGGLLTNILFGTLAISGYLVTGLGDAIGEPVGAMIGKHPYRVVSLSSVPAIRSWEGSIAVFIMSALALYLAAASSPHIAAPSLVIGRILVIAGVCALAEALSPHGWDNATLQLIPSALVWVWMKV
jgi:phytol kinase